MSASLAVATWHLVLGLEVFDVTLIGVNTRTGTKLLFSLVLFAVVYGLRSLALVAVRRAITTRPDPAGFWSRQGVQLIAALVMTLGLVSIWVTPDTDITTGLGLVSAGLAFALQQVVTAIAGYVVILRGDTFNVGDRISLGSVRGDVIRLGFIKTTIMEMGQPPSMADSTAATWVHARQYTGRLVTVSNARVFDEPVFNYSRDFPFVWEEMVLPITHDADRERVEQVLLDAAGLAMSPEQVPDDALAELRRKYAVRPADLEPAVFMRITDNWLELSLRFIVPVRSVRGTKDRMTRHVLAELDAAGIGIASATYDVVGMPPLRLVDATSDGPGAVPVVTGPEDAQG